MIDKDEEERQRKIQKERERIAMLSCKPNENIKILI